MEVNVTLVVQMIHFGIAYMLIDRIFLRTVFRYIEQEDAQRHDIEQQALAQQQHIVALEQQNEQDWIILQKRLVAESPRVQFRVQRIYAEPSLPSQFPSEQEMRSLITLLEQEIVTKVRHD